MHATVAELKVSPETMALYHKLLKCIELLVVDSASNELLSGTMMQHNICPEQGDDLFNLHGSTRDLPHGIRRMLQRPWLADPYLDSIIRGIIMNGDSLFHMLTYKRELALWLQEIIEQQTDGRTLTNVRYAPQRFDSLTAPIGTYCWDWDELCVLATHVKARRSGTSDAKNADKFLSMQEMHMKMIMPIIIYI